jgi:hypothetical protein
MGGKPPASLAAGEKGYLQAMFCPGYGKFSKEDPNKAMERVNYMVTVQYRDDKVGVNVPVAQRPFGYPNVSEPIKSVSEKAWRE